MYNLSIDDCYNYASLPLSVNLTMAPSPFLTFSRWYLRSFEGLSKGIYLLAAMMLLNRIGTLILPFLTLYVTEELHLSILDAGSATSAFGLGSLAGAYLGGWTTDKVGARPTMIFSLSTAAILFFATQYVNSLLPLCILLFCSALCSDMLRPAVMATSRSYSSEQTQTRALSLLRMAFNLGFAIGPAIAGIFLLYYSYRVLFVIDSLTCLLALLFLWFFLRDDGLVVRPPLEHTDLLSKDNPYTDGPFLALLFFFLLLLTAFFQLMFTMPLYIRQELLYDKSIVGLFFALNGILVMVVEMPLVHYVEQRYRSFSVMITGAALIVIGTVCLLYTSPALVGILAYVCFISIGEIINFPFVTTVAMRRASPKAVGKYMAAIGITFSVSLIISPRIGTYLLDLFGYPTLWVTMAALAAIAVVGTQYVRRYFVDVQLATT